MTIENLIKTTIKNEMPELVEMAKKTKVAPTPTRQIRSYTRYCQRLMKLEQANKLSGWAAEQLSGYWIDKIRHEKADPYYVWTRKLILYSSRQLRGNKTPEIPYFEDFLKEYN